MIHYFTKKKIFEKSPELYMEYIYFMSTTPQIYIDKTSDL